MQQDLPKEKPVKKKKIRAWTEAARIVLEYHPKTPLTHKEIFNEICSRGLKDASSPASLACLNAMLHAHSRGPDAIFYRVWNASSVFGLKNDIPSGAVISEVDEDSGPESEDGEPESSSLSFVRDCFPRDRKKAKVLYVKLPSGYRSSSPSVSSSSTDSQSDVPSNLTASSGDSKIIAERLSQGGTVQSREDQISLLNGEKEVSTLSLPESSTSSSEKLKDTSINDDPGGNSSLVADIDTSDSNVAQSNPPTTHYILRHSLRHQQQRQQRNSTMSLRKSVQNIPRIIMKPVPPQNTSQRNCTRSSTSMKNPESISVNTRPQTVREMLASLPGLGFKPRKRPARKLSMAAQIAQSRKGCIDLETPDSILASTNIKTLLNKHTFASLPPLYQFRLVQMLPAVDRMVGPDYSVRLSGTALSNEFFTRACQEWKERLIEGEFTPENQLKLKAERERSKLDPWKVKNFEPVWGQRLPSEDQSKQPFGLNPSPNKPMQSIKVKPVVKNNRKVPSILKHRTETSSVPCLQNTRSRSSSPNQPVLRNSSLKRSVRLQEPSPPSKKARPVRISSSPYATVSEPATEVVSESVKLTSLSPLPAQEGAMALETVQQSSSSPVVSQSPAPALDKAASTTPPSVEPLPASPKHRVVPPITIRSIPVQRSSCKVSENLLNVEERSYQVCTTSVQPISDREVSKSPSPKQRTPSPSSGSDDSMSAAPTKAVPDSTENSEPVLLLNQSVELVAVPAEDSSPASISDSSLRPGTVLIDTSDGTVLTQEINVEANSTASRISFEGVPESSTSQCLALACSESSEVPASENSVIALSPGLSFPSSEQPSIVMVTENDALTSSASEQVIVLAADMAFAVDSADSSENAPTTLVITTEDGTGVEGLFNSSNSEVVLLTGSVPPSRETTPSPAFSEARTPTPDSRSSPLDLLRNKTTIENSITAENSVSTVIAAEQSPSRVACRDTPSPVTVGRGQFQEPKRRSPLIMRPPSRVSTPEQIIISSPTQLQKTISCIRPSSAPAVVATSRVESKQEGTPKKSLSCRDILAINNMNVTFQEVKTTQSPIISRSSTPNQIPVTSRTEPVLVISSGPNNSQVSPICVAVSMNNSGKNHLVTQPTTAFPQTFHSLQRANGVVKVLQPVSTVGQVVTSSPTATVVSAVASTGLVSSEQVSLVDSQGASQQPVVYPVVSGGNLTFASVPVSQAAVLGTLADGKVANVMQSLPAGATVTVIRAPMEGSNGNNCVCNLKPMVMCRKCGAFCHNDCIGPSRLCVTCLIR